MRAMLALLSLALAVSMSREVMAMKIVDNGIATATVVMPAEPSATERFAAGELRDYLNRISGAELTVESEGRTTVPPRIFIGATQAGRPVREELGRDEPEAFAVRTAGDDLVLVGASDRGALYAVYDFLEQDLGCRWLGPGELWEEIPETTTIEIGGIDRIERPAMKWRYLAMTAGGPEGSWGADCLSWAAKAKINIGAGWPRAELPDGYLQRGGFRAWMSPHVLHRILDPDKYFDEHPEWYALIDGERKRMPKAGFQQLCTTNPEVIEKVAEGLGEMFDARPEVDFMGLGQSDGTAFCQCENCTALDTGEIWPYGNRNLPVITERWLTFVNAVARRLQQTHPGKCIYTLAYHQTFRPPDPEVIKPEPNVIIQVVNSRPNYVCFVHRFENPDCPHHVAFREGLEKWVQMTPAGVTIYEYTPHSTFCSMPYPAAAKFVDDINYLHRIGVAGYEGQSVPNLWGTYGINYYAIARCTWEEGIEPEALVKEYCDAAFGPASEQMQAFLRTVEEAMIAADHITEGVWSYMTPEVMAAARGHLDAAHAAAQDAPDRVRARLRDWEISFHYGELGAQAWWTAQKALADHDAEALQRAIDLADAAAQYLADEREKQPHHAGAPGKLTKVYVKYWQRMLDKW
ncbi:MAG: DUF4838 domain-containing protein [Armatimonadetes bacterium]|nr:DUF4838 domain-containing protein [Armatimonadota bacterium]